MVGTPERRHRYDFLPLLQFARNGVDYGGFHHLLSGQRREDGRNAPSNHGFAASGTSHHQESVVAGHRNHGRPLGIFLAADIAKIRIFRFPDCRPDAFAL